VNATNLSQPPYDAPLRYLLNTPVLTSYGDFRFEGPLTLAAARAFVAKGAHSAIGHAATGYVSPQQRHAGEDQAILAARHELYTRAKLRNPARWSGNTGDWSYLGVVTLNPERDAVVNIAAAAQNTQHKAA